MLAWLKSLLRPASVESPVARSQNTHPARVDSAPRPFTSINSVSGGEFAVRAAHSPANAVVAIELLIDTTFAVDSSLVASGIDHDAAADLRAAHLIGICPRCDGPYSHLTFTAVAVGKMMPSMPVQGGTAIEKLILGRCYRAACESTTVLLFWCADLDSDAVRYLAARSVSAGAASAKRDALWPARE